jgi:hypothetical protein
MDSKKSIDNKADTKDKTARAKGLKASSAAALSPPAVVTFDFEDTFETRLILVVAGLGSIHKRKDGSEVFILTTYDCHGSKVIIQGWGHAAGILLSLFE